MSETFPGVWFELSKSQRKAFESFGHVWTKLAQAQTILLKKAQKGQVPSALQPWLNVESPSSDLSPGFVLVVEALGLDDETAQYQWRTAVSEAEGLNFWKEAWQQYAPEKTPSVDWTVVSPSMNAPMWPAVLRLHELKAFWIQELRQNHYEALIQWLPEAWLYLDDPLPPGATLARLGKRTWVEVLREGGAWETLSAFDAQSHAPLTIHALEQGLQGLNIMRRAPSEFRYTLGLFFSHQNGKTQLMGAVKMP